MKRMILSLKGLQKLQVLEEEAQSSNKSMSSPGLFKSKIITTAVSSLEKSFSKSKKQLQRSQLGDSLLKQALRIKGHK